MPAVHLPAAGTRRAGLRRRLLDGLAVLVVATSVRQGGFYPPDDLVAPAVALLLALGLLATATDEGRRRALSERTCVAVVALLGLAAWWAVRADQAGDWDSSRQVVGCALGFAACFAAGATLDEGERLTLVRGAGWLGALLGLVGLVAVALRSYPLALPAQDAYRLATTLTYSNAAGALLAVVALAVVASPRSRVRDGQLLVVVAALIATQSRGAVLGGVLALVLLRHHARAAARPLVLGAVTGTAFVATSAGPEPRLEALLVLLAALVAGSARAVRLPGRRVALPVLVLAPLSGLLLLGDELRAAVSARLDTASVSDRQLEWSAAWQRLQEDPLTGGGPGERLVLSDGRTARFVHNELLQVAADTGLVGACLLLAALAAGLLRRGASRPVAAGAAVLLSTCVSAAVDFPWHVPAVVMSTGLLMSGAVLADSRGRPATTAPGS